VDAVCREAVKSMVDGPTTCFPPRAPPRAGLAEEKIMGASNPGLHPGLSKFRPSGPVTNQKNRGAPTGNPSDKYIMDLCFLSVRKRQPCALPLQSSTVSTLCPEHRRLLWFKPCGHVRQGHRPIFQGRQPQEFLNLPA
jgi:hypothetical protein